LTFRGTFEHALDAKNRLTIPARFRSALAGAVVLAATPELDSSTPRSVAIWTPEAYDSYTETVLKDLNPLSPKARELKRFFFSSSFDTELDSAGRVMLPPYLLSYAGLGKDVVVTGAGESLEVWDRAAYASYQQDVTRRVPELAASLGDTA
jgi:MraZ protein